MIIVSEDSRATVPNWSFGQQPFTVGYCCWLLFAVVYFCWILLVVVGCFLFLFVV